MMMSVAIVLHNNHDETKLYKLEQKNKLCRLDVRMEEKD